MRYGEEVHRRGAKGAEWIRAAAGLAVAAALGVGAYGALRRAYAELLYTQESKESARRATEVEPKSAQYQVRRAETLDGPGEEEARVAALRRATELNPRDAEAWIELGVLAETRGDLGNAERWLLEAARVDKGYDPRWTLAQYYFRREDREKFWKWVREALEMGHGEMTPLLRMCWTLSRNGKEILEQAIPERAEAERQYLGFLLGERRWEAAGQVAKRMAAAGRREDVPALLGYCDRMLEEKRGGDAAAVWNALSEKRLIEHGAAGPEGGAGLVNGGFERVPGSRGFDWHVSGVEGVVVTRDRSEPVLRVNLTGRQPEQCEILWQHVVLAGGRAYQLVWEYETEGIAAVEGLAWELAGMAGAGGAMGRAVLTRRETWGEGMMRFQAPEGLELGRLSLVYRRALGTRRIEGTFSLRNVRLKPEE